jgi:hypothetical protein
MITADCIPPRSRIESPAMRPIDFFGIYDRALDAEFCRSVIRRFEEDPRKVRGKIGDGTREGAIRPEVKSTTEILLTAENPGWEDVLEHVTACLKDILPRYIARWRAGFPVPLRTEDFRVSRYLPGEQFAHHSDNIGGSVTRVITAQWFLNDVAEGGATEFPWQKLAVEAREGRLMLAPVGWTYLHRGAAPVSGPKYIIITQLHQVLPPRQ